MVLNVFALGLIVGVFVMSGQAQITITESNDLKDNSNVVATKADDDIELNNNWLHCPMHRHSDKLSQDLFSSELTKDCRYDRLSRPNNAGPLNITFQLDIKHMEAMEQLQFKMHMLVQYRYMDDRLAYSEMSPSRGKIIGGRKLRDKIWIPHIVLSNERDTSIMGLEDKDIFVSISPKGEVVYSYRMTAQIYCWMDLRKFPFDDQVCDVNFRSWTYNASSILLHWEEHEAVKVASQLHLTEFKLIDWSYNVTDPVTFTRGSTVGKYSNLVFKFKISREIGFYIMDYFLPSGMLVCISWLSFWLQADNSAPRISLGITTMLSFITLATGQTKRLPKVSYIKASEIWFLGCIVFIFGSLTEFAFVNIIWRRKKKVELKKVNSKYIFKSTLTPKLARRELQKSSSMNNLHRTISCSSLVDEGKDKSKDNENSYNNYLTVHGYKDLQKIRKQSEAALLSDSRRNSVTSLAIPVDGEETANVSEWATMTPQEIAIWIDKRARFAFPLAFIVFNIFYWSFVYLV